ncbi:hypothetical protein ACQY0O_002135 [Thecaphora frezii]
MCSPNVHFDQRGLSFGNSPFLTGAFPLNSPGPSSLSRKASYYDGSSPRLARNGFSDHAGRGDLDHSASPAGFSSASLHHTISHSSSVLSLVVDEQRALVFSGSQSECIYVWDLRTYQQRTRLEGHTGSVLALELAPEKNWLFSSSGDNTVRIWDTATLKPLYVIYPAEDNVGDIFALKWCSELEILYLGCQDTSIQWISLSGIRSSAAQSGSHTRGYDSPTVAAPSSFPISRPHKFFDSIPVALKRSANACHSYMATSKPDNRGGATPSATVPASGGRASLARGQSQERQPAGSAYAPTAAHGGPCSKLTDQVLSAAAEKLQGLSISMADAEDASEGADAADSQASPAQVVETLVVPHSCSVPSAHFGYIYTFALLTLEGDAPHRKVLVSGSGDETVKLWHVTPQGLTHLATLESPNADGNAVMALASWKSTLFSGLQGGDVEVWDLETCTLVRTLRAHSDDVLALEACSFDGCLFTASADGRIRRWDRSFRCTDDWLAHDGIVLSLAAVRQPSWPPASQQPVAGRPQRPRRVLQLVTGSSDDLIKIWNLPNRGGYEFGANGFPTEEDDRHAANDEGSAYAAEAAYPSAPESSTLLSNLAQFVRYRSISSLEENREDCRQAAHFLKACLTGLGAEAKILANQPGRNPLVLATFKANAARSRSRRTGDVDSELTADTAFYTGREEAGDAREPKKRCLFYGHYDCIAAEGQWESDPFQMDGRDGYLYGRGVSDNKGPILAAACAASQLLTLRKLEADVVFLIEGEEETGSVGFTEAVRTYKDDIGHIDVILLSNSYWLGEDTPCLTVGLRGVVRATIKISSDEPDVHSGVEGGAVREPMIDMVHLLASLSDGDRVTIPGFYDTVRPVTPEETAQYEAIARIKQLALTSSRQLPQSTAQDAEALMAKWRHPSLSVHHIKVSGPGNSTVIPSTVSATVSLRLVPDQSLEEIEAALNSHVKATFAALSGQGSAANKVQLTVDHRADWWLGSESSRYFQHLQAAVREEWGLDQQLQQQGPISIREGGSIPAIAILEKELDAQAVHLPMGQSSDRAHLPNERIRLINLEKGKAVVRRFLLALGGRGDEVV